MVVCGSNDIDKKADIISEEILTPFINGVIVNAEG